jgi:anhydro-N-acetylmuramic acid kinase
MRVLGLMSGTSADGVDAVLAEFAGAPQQPQWTFLNLASTPYPNQLRQALINVGQGKALSSKDWLELAESVTAFQFQAAQACDPTGQAEVVGCHGQTVWHRPPNTTQRGASWQMLQAPLLAQLLNRPVVHDFRAKDLALGGQGAPLVPMADAALLGRISGWRAILNLGGIANLTLIPPKAGPDREAHIQGWDCGPANSLVDLAMAQISAGKLAFDLDGEMAAKGKPDEACIKSWLKEPYFQAPPPKSTGREQFGIIDLKRRLQELKALSSVDTIATLTAFSAAAVAHDLDNVPIVRPLGMAVAGGGSSNPVLMAQLRSRCRGIKVQTIEELGLRSEAREALAFALLAWWHCIRHPGSAPSITGARRAAVLGTRVDPG